MPHALNLAIALPALPVLLAAPALIIVVLGVAMTLKKSKSKKAASAAWTSATHELGIEIIDDGAKNATAEGKVNNHVVVIGPHEGPSRKDRVQTQYRVKFEAPEAPKFALIKRDSDVYPIVDTGNPKFDVAVAIQTEQPVLLSRFLTASRRAAILRLLTYWPTAEISNREAHLFTPGIETDHDKLVDSICHLVAAAETFDRPTPRPSAAPAVKALVADASEIVEATDSLLPPPPAAVTTDDEDVPVPADQPMPEPVGAAAQQAVNGEADVLTEVRLDEVTVLQDLFNSGLTEEQTVARFAQTYQGREINWAGQILRIGAADHLGRQRIAALVGSADGQNPASGRVVALTAIVSETPLAEGDIVSFGGALMNLDATKRLFQIA